MTKYIFSFLMVSLLALPTFAADANLTGKEIVGIWWSPKKDARIEITEDAGVFNGKIIWAIPEKQEKLDTNNPDPAKQSQKILGSTILSGFKFEDNKWQDGKIYDPENGKTYSCKMSMDGANLRVRGFIGISLLGRTEIFTPYVADAKP